MQLKRTIFLLFVQLVGFILFEGAEFHVDQIGLEFIM